MIREDVERIIGSVLDEGDIPIGEFGKEEDRFTDKLEDFFNLNEIEYIDRFDDMFDSCGFDCWSYSIAWVEDGKPQLLVYRVVSC